MSTEQVDNEAVKSMVRMLRNFGGAMPPQRYDEAAELLAGLAEALAASEAKVARLTAPVRPAHYHGSVGCRCIAFSALGADQPDPT